MTIQSMPSKTQVCACGNPFVLKYRNGIKISNKCPKCQLNSLYRQFKPKGVVLASELNRASKTKEKRKKTPRQKAMDKADKIFSRYIRVLNAIERNGELICKDIITGTWYGIKNTDNGHCLSRSYKATRFEVDNCRPQNRSSNRFSGEADHYKFIDNLKQQIGEERFSHLLELKDTVVHDTEEWYLQNYRTYKLLLKELLKERGWKDPWKKKS